MHLISRIFFGSMSDLKDKSKMFYAHCANYTHTLWKNEKFSLTENFFRQINHLVIISLVKPLLFAKNVWENFCNFHNVNYGHLLLQQLFDENFVKTTLLLMKLLQKLISWKTFSESLVFHFTTMGFVNSISNNVLSFASVFLRI